MVLIGLSLPLIKISRFFANREQKNFFIMTITNRVIFTSKRTPSLPCQNWLVAFLVKLSGHEKRRKRESLKISSKELVNFVGNSRLQYRKDTSQGKLAWHSVDEKQIDLPRVSPSEKEIDPSESRIMTILARYKLTWTPQS